MEPSPSVSNTQTPATPAAPVVPQTPAPAPTPAPEPTPEPVKEAPAKPKPRKRRKPKVILATILIAALVVTGLYLLYEYVIFSVPATLAEYDGIVNSASTEEEAKEAIKDYYSSSAGSIIFIKTLEETDDYYGLSVVWKYESKNDSSIHKQNVVSFKKSVWDYQYVYNKYRGWQTVANQFTTTDKDKIKNILDSIHKIEGSDGFIWEDSTLEETDDYYIYEMKYKEKAINASGEVEGETERILTITIMKKTGEIKE